eukprot:TRINITY_DN22140_c0_g1_i1.p1 TRINITY_DN22140_c0_g1~~TRINITY_DN22140_c0_g1_i1.p1  ORF type:complete len:627 (+),score=95.32 TRINITY_DN22140_c0_g1_i1:127-2007(+)
MPQMSLVRGDVEQADSSVADSRSDCREGLNIEWRDIECFVSEKEEEASGMAKWRTYCLQQLGWESEGPPTKQVLRGARGFARRGEVLAVMGPSGSGKTTLLNVLAQRPTLGARGYWKGDILVNGATPWPDWEREMAYVMQKDIFYEELKVCENLRTTALLRLPHCWPKSKKLDELQSMVKKFGLEDVADSKIGSAIDRGLSGGEVKRTSIANEMLGMPQLFFLDEPLTGLDSTRAVEVMKMLRELASKHGTTIMLTIHQPSSALYECFDRLLLMGKGGRTAFFGSMSEAKQHFKNIGREVPPDWSPCDHYIELLSSEETREEVCDQWETHEATCSQREGAQTQPGFPVIGAPTSLSVMPPISYQIQVLLPRQFLRIKRSYLTRIQLKMQIGLALTWGIIFFRVAQHVPERVDDYVGALFFIVAHWSWCPLFQGLNNFPMEKDMLTKERASKVYDMFGYFAAHVMAEAPLLLAFPLVFFVIIWPLAGMPWQALPQAFLLIALNIQVSSAMSLLISAIFMDPDTGIAAAVMVMVAQMCAGGYFADMRKLPWFISWIRYTSFYFYTYGAITRLTIKEPFGEDLLEQALRKHSFSELGYFWEVVCLAGMSILFRLLSYLQLRSTKKLQFS